MGVRLAYLQLFRFDDLFLYFETVAICQALCVGYKALEVSIEVFLA